MPKKIPLVLYSGEPAQLQAGDYINDEINPSFTNGEAGSIVAGNALYLSANDTVKKAKADAGATVPCIGFCIDATVATSASANVQVDGIITLTTAQWDAVAGTTGGLTAKTKYYLSDATGGNITDTPVSTLTHYSQRVGIAISATELLIQLDLPFYQL